MEDLEVDTATVTTGLLKVAGLRCVRTGAFPATLPFCNPSDQIFCRLLFNAIATGNVVLFTVTEQTVHLGWLVRLGLYVRAGCLGL